MAVADRWLPTGTITFLRSDIEGSTRLAQALGPEWEHQQARHHAIVRAAIATHHGHEVRTEGDAFLVAFPDAIDAMAAAASIGTALAAEPWPPAGTIRVRIGLHAGAAQRSGDDYGGMTLHRTARIAEAASGGQVLLSDAVRAIVAGTHPAGCTVRDLGWFRLRGFDAAERLYQLDVEGLPTQHPPLRGVVPDADHLPVGASPFIGRAAELERLEALLSGTRLLTLTGPGGTGKTRLAVELARRVLPRYPDGAWFIDLAPVTDPSDVLPAIAHGLGLFDGPAGPAADRLGPYLAARTMLLVLDNLEQVVAAAPDIAGLLGRGPGLVIVATSRVPLGLGAEQVAPIRPMGLAGTDAPDALVLCLDRLRRARPDLEVDEGVRSVAAGICAAVDGLPLGIELAAARARSLPLAAIRDRLVAHAPLPGSAPRDLPARQQTLERTIAWSLSLLPAGVLERFGRLGAFEGGFGLEQVDALEAGAGDDGMDALDALVALADHSLMAPMDLVDEPRYEMLETIRAASVGLLVSGRAGLPEADVRARHAAVFRDLAARAAAEWGTRRQAEWLARLARDHANLRAALGWAIEAGELELARGLSASLWRYWLMRGGLVQGRAFADAVLAMPGGDVVSLSLAGALDAAGGLAYWMADTLAANAIYQRQLEVARQLDDARAIADAAFNLTHTGYITGDMDAPRVTLREAQLRYGEVGDKRGLMRVEWSFTVMDIGQEPPDESERRLRGLLERATQLDDLPYVALLAGTISLGALGMGDIGATLRHGLLSLRVSHLLGDQASIALAFLPAAVIALGVGRPVEAARFLSLFDALCEVHGVRPPGSFDQFGGIDGDPADGARAMLGDEVFEAEQARGRSMTAQEGLELVEGLARDLGVDPSAS